MQNYSVRVCVCVCVGCVLMERCVGGEVDNSVPEYDVSYASSLYVTIQDVP